MMPSGVALIPAEAIDFGVDDPPPLRLRHVRKPPRKEPAGAWWAVCGLWGFGVGAAVVGDGFAKIAERWVPLITVESSLLRRWMA
jgi:hypothetical protein